MAHDDPVLEQAAEWAVRAGDPAFDDWDGLSAWLESDPAHAEAYARLTAAVADAAEQLPGLHDVANDDEPARGHSRRAWLGGLVAAAIAGLAAFGAWQLQGSGYTVETGLGEQRTIALEGGGTIQLAGGTRIVLDRKDPRSASLESGQALFTIRHDPQRPFRLEVGEDELVDIGTVFDVKHSGGNVRLAVAEGAVAFNPAQQNVRVDPGEQLVSDSGSAAYRLTQIPVAQIGEWREGRLTFQDETLEQVAQDLSRASGIAFQAAPEAARRRVSGSLLIEPLRSDPRAAGPLLGVGVRSADGGWVLEAQ